MNTTHDEVVLELVEDAPDRPPVFGWRDLAVGLGFLGAIRLLSVVTGGAQAALPPWGLLLISIVFQHGFMLFYPLWLARRRDTPPVFQRPRIWQVVQEFAIAFPIVIGIIIVLITTAQIVSRVSPRTSLTPEILQRAAATPSLPFIILFVVAATVIAPICEEVFFRGFVQAVLRPRITVWGATLVQSALFAVGHTFGLVHMLFVFVLGLIFTGVRESRQSLVTPMFVHAGNNLFASVGFLILVILNQHAPVLGVFGHDHPEGCQVDEVAVNSGASEAGITAGDIVTSINQEPVKGFLPMRLQLAKFRGGDTVTVSILRNGIPLELQVVLQERPNRT
ncbi:MAG: CPBP family intramembrane metalloprotease [Planctomycetes bacterium]|nr:CPBP family intramembrane metalloprotease [Planctomycetota bacterium]